MQSEEKAGHYSHILVALDGSEDSLAGGELALDIAERFGSGLRAVHVYDTAIHNTRFREMEPGLPPRYQTPDFKQKLRAEHDSLMQEGFMALSLGYMEDFLRRARERGVAVAETAVSGRNYLTLLDLLGQGDFDLAILGACGLGTQADGMLGSTVIRVLRRSPVDIIVARAGERRGGALACVDGSRRAASAMGKAAVLAGGMDWRLELLAAYDTAFHRTIFRTMARSLSAGRQQEIGLDRQEAVHEELIDKSLKALYGSFLEAAAAEVARGLPGAGTSLRPGKAYRAIVDHAAETGIGLIVLGRYGHNYQVGSDIGSHAEAVARLAPCHVLICGGEEASPVRNPADLAEYAP